MISTTTCRSRSGPELLQNLTLQQKHRVFGAEVGGGRTGRTAAAEEPCPLDRNVAFLEQRPEIVDRHMVDVGRVVHAFGQHVRHRHPPTPRSEEHTSVLQSLMRISYTVSC